MDERPDAAASTPGLVSTGDACHILPCKIDYSGPAAVDVYFQPTPIPPTRSGRCITVSNDDYKKLLSGSIPSTTTTPPINSADGPPKVQAAQFRGRGLLAAFPPTPVRACVLTLNTNTTGSSMVAAAVEKQAAVSAISEWQHEHQESVVLRAQQNMRGRVARGLEFCRIAAALHETMSAPPDGP